MLQMLNAGLTMRALCVAAELEIADRLAAGPRTLAELATATGVHQQSLGRLLRLLAGAGYQDHPHSLPQQHPRRRPHATHRGGPGPCSRKAATAGHQWSRLTVHRAALQGIGYRSSLPGIEWDNCRQSTSSRPLSTPPDIVYDPDALAGLDHGALPWPGRATGRSAACSSAKPPSSTRACALAIAAATS
jgi:hypothetical protein